ncbi:ParA family protein [Streptomyces sp. G-5]|uniref:ParA family protein n=1 Tax=Streptomyces sp. G-5 TaxID=2977231 RepID=UPI0021CE3EAC|nr:ParA family protein [Streptomyces sp. G-5]MCU4750283.1 ParA family protein [Streptomyces sp. G-5]
MAKPSRNDLPVRSYTPPRYAPHLPVVFLTINRAGSVGKTTFGNTFASTAALRGYNGLIIDADLQSDMSRWFGYDGDFVPDGVPTVHDLMLGKNRLDEVLVPARTRIAPDTAKRPFEIIPGLDLVRGSAKMSQADGELVQDGRGIFWLQSVLKKQVPEGRYDFILIDAPASFGRLSESLMLAASDLITMMKPMRKELRGALALKRNVEDLNEKYEDFGASAQCTWYCINDAKSDSGSQGQFYANMQEEAQSLFGAQNLLPGIRNTVVLPEAYDAEEPLPFWAPRSESMGTFNTITDQMGFPVRLAA